MNYTETEILRLQKRLSFIQKCFRALAYDFSKKRQYPDFALLLSC